MNYVLVDPLSTKNLWPLSATRPIADFRIGILKISEKWELYFSTKCSHLCRSELSNLFPPNIEELNLLIVGNLLSDKATNLAIQSLNEGEILYDKNNNFIAAKLSKQDFIIFQKSYNDNKLEEFFSLKKIVYLENRIEKIDHLWDLFEKNTTELKKDFNYINLNFKSQKLSTSNKLIGSQIFIEEGANIECSILNAETGPIYIGKNAEIMEGSVIRGPFALGENACLKISSKVYGATTIGPNCKVGGEVNNSIFFANSNKAHDGFIGHSVIGEWCNIGADTNNSNLKNTYSEVKLWNYETNNFVKTGSIFCGLIMGDHAKCGINTMFNTGTVVGVGANIFGSGYPRQFIPDFAWGGASGFSTFKMPAFIETAKAVMARRKFELTSDQMDLLQKVYDQTAVYRTWE